MFPKIFDFVKDQVVPKLEIYDSFTGRDVFFTGFTLECMVEINSPLWLKAGVYHISCEDLFI